MGKVIITYSRIKDSAKNAERTASYYDDFYSELNSKVYNQLSISDGSDSSGYISSAKNVVYNKIKDLNNKKNKYSNLAKSLYDVQSRIEQCENTAKKAVTSIAENELGLKNRKWYEQVGDWIYGTFCVDLMNSNPLTRGLGNMIKSGLDYFNHGMNKVIDFFKHGDGKYWLNIGLSILGDIAAVAGTVAAIALCVGATVVTGGVAAPLLVAAVASCIGTVMTLADSGFTIYNNIKALKISKETDDPGRARYYGNVSGVSGAINKYDMGGETANKVWEGIGVGYDVTHTAADVTAVVAGAVGAAGLSETKVVDASGRTSIDVHYDPTKVKQNLGGYIKEKFGYRNVNGKWKFDAKYAFGKDKTGITKRIDILKNKGIREGLNISHSKYKIIKKIVKITKTPKKIVSKIDNYDKINSVIKDYDNVGSINDAYKKIIKPGLKIISDSGRIITSPINTLNDTVIKIIDAGIKVAS